MGLELTNRPELGVGESERYRCRHSARGARSAHGGGDDTVLDFLQSLVGSCNAETGFVDT